MSKDNLKLNVADLHNAVKVGDKIEISLLDGTKIASVEQEKIRDFFIGEHKVVKDIDGAPKEIIGESLTFVDDVTNSLGWSTIIYQTNSNNEIVSSSVFGDDSYGSFYRLLDGDEKAEAVYNQIRDQKKRNSSYEEICTKLNEMNDKVGDLRDSSLFMYVNPAMKNPKTGEDVRAAEIAKLQKLKEEGFSIIGLEMTVPALAELCDRNIDPQHTGGDETRCCAKEIFEKAPEYLGWFKSKDLDKVMFVTNRVDVDSIAAFVLAERYLKGEKLGSKENIEKINEHDAFQGAKWEGPKPIEQAFDPENKTAALASSIKVFTVTPKNIEDVEAFVDTGTVEEGVMTGYRKAQTDIIDKVKSGEIKTEVVGGVAYVETTLPCATNVGYSMAPVVVAVNPAMKLGPEGEPFRKVSICQHEAGYVDLNTVADELNKKEAGWGGSPTFKGSKQGESCTIELSEIKKTVFTNLTPEYKAKVTAQAGKFNAKGGRGE